MHKLLGDVHDAFCLEEQEHGETDLITMEIDTGETWPRKLPARRMPHAVHQEVAKHPREMQ